MFQYKNHVPAFVPTLRYTQEVVKYTSVEDSVLSQAALFVFSQTYQQALISTEWKSEINFPVFSVIGWHTVI